MNKRKIKSKYLLSSYITTCVMFMPPREPRQIYTNAFVYRIENKKVMYRPARVIMQYLNCIRKEEPVNEFKKKTKA